MAILVCFNGRMLGWCLNNSITARFLIHHFNTTALRGRNRPTTHSYSLMVGQERLAPPLGCHTLPLHNNF